jgi:hypothetical protein
VHALHTALRLLQLQGCLLVCCRAVRLETSGGCSLEGRVGAHTGKVGARKGRAHQEGFSGGARNTYKVAQVLGLTAPAKQLSIHASWADTPMAVATARVAKMRRGLTSIASVGEEEESDGRELTGAWVTLVVLCNLGDIRFDILLTVETRRQFPLLTFFCRSSHGIEKEFNWLGRLS